MGTWHSVFPCITPFDVGIASGVQSASLQERTGRVGSPARKTLSLLKCLAELLYRLKGLKGLDRNPGTQVSDFIQPSSST